MDYISDIHMHIVYGIEFAVFCPPGGSRNYDVFF